MTVLGIDPGTSHTGWALADGSACVDCGAVYANHEIPWRVRRPQIVAHLARVIGAATERGCRVVAVEETAVNHGVWEQLKAGQATHAQARSQAVHTQQTEELAGAIACEAARHGCEVVRVRPVDGLHRLGLKSRPKPTDGAQSAAFLALTGRKLRATEHHIARAYGVALHGAMAHRIGAAAPEREATQ